VLADTTRSRAGGTKERLSIVDKYVQKWYAVQICTGVAAQSELDLESMRKFSLFYEYVETIPFVATRVCLATLLAVGTLAGCQTTSNFQDLEPQPIPTREMAMDYEYRLETGDRLELKFLFNEELDESILVGPDGNASLRLIGTVPMAGHTLAELQSTLKERYDQHVRVPELTLSLTEVSSQKVFVGGDVARPGMYESDGGLTLMQAIFMAGGYNSTGKLKSVVVLRDNGEPVLDYYIVNVGNDLSTLANIRDLRLQGRDIVYVPKSTVGSINQFLNVHLAGLKEILSVFNFTVTYDLNNSVRIKN